MYDRSKIVSELCYPAVYEQFDARDEAAVVGGEEQGGVRDFLGSTEAPHRDEGDDERHEPRDFFVIRRSFETSPCTAMTFLPICLTALLSSSWRRPVMKT